MKEKIDLLVDLDEKEKAKLPKFYSTLALSTKEELQAIINFLDSKGIKITKICELKVLGNTLEEVQNKFNVLEQIDTTDVLKQNPLNINKNVIDIYKRITYCKQYGIEIKNEKGAYKNFLFSSTLWREELERHANDKKVEEPVVEEKKEEAPVIEETKVSNEEVKEESTPSVSSTDNKEDYFEKIRAELEETRKALYNEFKSLDVNEEHKEDDLISFEDLDKINNGRGM